MDQIDLWVLFCMEFFKLTSLNNFSFSNDIEIILCTFFTLKIIGSRLIPFIFCEPTASLDTIQVIVFHDSNDARSARKSTLPSLKSVSSISFAFA